MRGEWRVIQPPASMLAPIISCPPTMPDTWLRDSRLDTGQGLQRRQINCIHVPHLLLFRALSCSALESHSGSTFALRIILPQRSVSNFM